MSIDKDFSDYYFVLEFYYHNNLHTHYPFYFVLTVVLIRQCLD